MLRNFFFPKGVLTKIHYWVPVPLGLLLSLLLIKDRGQEFYALYALSSFYINAFTAFFSSKAFLYASVNSQLSKGLLYRTVVSESLLRGIGLVIAFTIAYGVSETYSELLIFLMFHSVISLIKLTDPIFEIMTVKDSNLEYYSEVQTLSRLLYYGAMIVGIYSADGFLFLYLGVAVCTFEAIFKAFYVLRSVSKLPLGGEMTVSAKESSFVYIIQNFCGVFNKQFDTFIIMFFVSDIVMFSVYLFVKQVHSMVMIATQPVMHFFFSGVNYRRLLYGLFVLYSLILVFSEVFVTWILGADYLELFRYFYIVWALSFASAIAPLYLARSGRFAIQMYISIICSCLLMCYLYFFEAYIDVEVLELIFVRIAIVLLATILQFSFVLRVRIQHAG